MSHSGFHLEVLDREKSVVTIHDTGLWITHHDIGYFKFKICKKKSKKN